MPYLLHCYTVLWLLDDLVYMAHIILFYVYFAEFSLKIEYLKINILSLHLLDNLDMFIFSKM